MSELQKGTGQAGEDNSLLSDCKKTGNTKQEMKCIVWNPRSLNNKIDYLVQMMEDNDIVIAVVSETWLTSATSYVTGYLRDHGYSIHHHYRLGQKGGGVAIIFANTIMIQQSKVHSFKSFECVSASFSGHSGKTFHLTAIYRCGDHLEPKSVFLKEFNDLVEFLHFTYYYIVLVAILIFIVMTS